MTGRGRLGLLPRLSLAAVAIVLFLLAYQWGNRYQASPSSQPDIAGLRIAPAKPFLPAPDSPDAHDEDISSPRLLGKWTLLARSDATEPAHSPTVDRLVEVYNRLADQPHLRRSLQVVLIATWPASPPTGDFARLSPAFHYLTADDPLWSRWHAAVSAIDLPARAGSTDAPPTLFLIDPRARLVVVFPARQAPASIAVDLVTMMDNRSP